MQRDLGMNNAKKQNNATKLLVVSQETGPMGSVNNFHAELFSNRSVGAVEYA